MEFKFWKYLEIGLISSLILATVHLSLRYWLRWDIHVVWRYVIGILAMYIPLTVYYWGYPFLVALWVVVIMTGITVAGLYALGSWWEKWHSEREQRKQVEHLERIIK